MPIQYNTIPIFRLSAKFFDIHDTQPTTSTNTELYLGCISWMHINEFSSINISSFSACIADVDV